MEEPMRASWAVVPAFCVSISAAGARAASVSAAPGDDLQAKVDALSPGDELVLASGVHRSRRISVTKRGKPDLWITIKGSNEGKTTIESSEWHLFFLRDCRFVRFASLEIIGARGAPQYDAFKFAGRCEDVVIEDCSIHDIGGAAISCSGVERVERLIVRGCRIWRTGGHGEGMYLGRQDGSGVVVNSVFERNWIHHTGGDQGDGIEINAGSVGNAVRDNVIHDTKFPCIFVENVEAGPPNIVERNVCWGAKDNVVQINGNAVVRNNIFLGPGKAVLRLGPEGKPRPGPGSTVKAFNNLLWSGGGEPAVSFAGDLDVIFANNIVDGGVTGKPKGLLTHNYWRLDILGDNAVPGPPKYDAAMKAFYPLSDSFADKGWRGDPDVPWDDFDGNVRIGMPDVGPYERAGTAHAGWKISPGLKPTAAARRREGPGAASQAPGSSEGRD